MPPDLLQRGREVLASQPFSRLLGAESVVLEAGCCELQRPITPELLQPHGFVQGGAVSDLTDNNLTSAGGTVLQLRVVTSEFKLNTLRPAVGERLPARAEAAQAGQSQAVCRCDVYAVHQGEETLCATGQGTIVRLPDGPPGEGG